MIEARGKTKPLTTRRTQQPRHHPDPRPGCQLCELAHTDPLLVALWGAYQQPKPPARREAIGEALKRHKSPVSVGEVERHMAHHWAVQPFPKWAQLQGSADRVMSKLTDRHLKILRFIGQAGTASSAQIDELFFFGHRRAGIEDTNVATTLRWMAYRHLLYRVWVMGQPKGSPSSVYALGRLGAEILTRLHPLTDGPGKPWNFVSEPQGVSPQMVPHDLGVGDLFLSLRQSQGQLDVSSRRLTAKLDPHNYWAAEHLGLTVSFPAYRNETGKRFLDRRRRIIRPDGFCVVGIELDQALPVGSSFGLPLVIEHDTGLRRNREVCEQLISYLHVGTDGALLRRFPDLQAPGYKVPVLFSTRGYAGGDGRIRRKHLREETLELIHKRGFTDRTPILMALQKDLRADGLMAEVRDLYSDESKPLLHCLIEASAPLMKAEQVSADTVLRIDRTGAAEKAPGAERDQISKSEAERLTREAEAEHAKTRAAQEAYERQFRAAEDPYRALPEPQGGQSR